MGSDIRLPDRVEGCRQGFQQSPAEFQNQCEILGAHPDELCYCRPSRIPLHDAGPRFHFVLLYFASPPGHPFLLRILHLLAATGEVLVIALRF